MSMLVYIFFLYSTTIPSAEGVIHQFYWKDYIPGYIPCDAYQGAPGKYIGQVNIEGHNLPATIYTHTNTAFTELGGMRSSKDDIKILCSADNNRFHWEYVDLEKTQGQEFQDAVKGGYETVNHFPSFVGKITHEEEWKIGKVNIPELSTKGLWLWDKQNKGVNFLQFFILKYNRTETCENHCHFV